MKAAQRRPIVAEKVESPGGLVAFLRARKAGLGALGVVLAAATVAGVAWNRFASDVRSRPEQILFPEDVELRGAAPWVRGDLREEALHNASLDGGVPLDDPELVQRLERAFSMHPWVRDVVRVELRQPAAALVEVRCREPAAMVAVPGGLLAVDADGVVLPSEDFTAESAAIYPRISGVRSSPVGVAGSRWGDPTVHEAAAIASAIGPEWRDLGLRDLRPVASREGRAWELVDASDRTVLFGSAPGLERGGEPGAAAKVARLRAAFDDPQRAERIDLTESH